MSTLTSVRAVWLLLAAPLLLSGCAADLDRMAECGSAGSGYSDPVARAAAQQACQDRYDKRKAEAEAREERAARRSGLASPQDYEREQAPRWSDEVAAARRDAEANSDSPLAWLNGIWCDNRDVEFALRHHRWQTVSPDVVREVLSLHGFRQSPASAPIEERRLAVEVQGGYYDLREVYEPTGIRRYDTIQELIRIRKVSDDEYRVVYEAQYEGDRLKSERAGGDEGFFRCM